MIPFLRSLWYLSGSSPSRISLNVTEIPETTCSTTEAVGTNVTSKVTAVNGPLVVSTETDTTDRTIGTVRVRVAGDTNPLIEKDRG